MATSQIDIVNMALSRLMTSRTLTSIDENRPEAVQMRIWYKQTLERLLAHPEHEWGFARRFTPLALVSPEYRMPGWRFTYAYPVDCLGLRDVGPVRSGQYVATGHPHEVAHSGQYQVIGSNCEDAFAVYTAMVNEANLPPLFIDAFIFSLAANTAMPITSSPQLAQQMQQSAAGAIYAAMARDKNEQNQRPEVVAESVRARFGGGGYDYPVNDTYDPWGFNRGR